MRQDENGTMTVLVSGNNISDIKADGIHIQGSDKTIDDNIVDVEATIQNNSATVRSDGFGAGILIEIGDGSGIAKNDVRLNISGNTLSGTETAAFFDFDITFQLNET